MSDQHFPARLGVGLGVERLYEERVEPADEQFGVTVLGKPRFADDSTGRHQLTEAVQRLGEGRHRGDTGCLRPCLTESRSSGRRSTHGGKVGPGRRKRCGGFLRHRRRQSADQEHRIPHLQCGTHLAVAIEGGQQESIGRPCRDPQGGELGGEQHRVPPVHPAGYLAEVVRRWVKTNVHIFEGELLRFRFPPIFRWQATANPGRRLGPQCGCRW